VSKVSTNERIARQRDQYVDCIAAELTEAAYPVVLRHGVRGSTIDLQLELWHALQATIRKRMQRASPG